MRDIPDLEDRLVAGMMLAQEQARGPTISSNACWPSEPEEFLPALFESEPLVHLVLRDYLQACWRPRS